MVGHGYLKTYRSNAVLTASPGQLVLMLYDGALSAMALAREAFDRPEEDPRRIEIINHQLQKAQRIIAELRARLQQPHELAYFDDGEFTIFLDDQHTDRLIALFQQRRLVAHQHGDCELHDALSEFVSHWLDVQSNMRHGEQEKAPQQLRRITSSA